jgi:hypothetical protein
VQVFNSAGVNVALNAGINGRVSQYTGGAAENGSTNAIFQTVTNGTTASIDYIGYSSTGGGLQIDLGSTYTDISHIKLWQYYADGRTYYNVTVFVSADGTTWTTVYGPANTTATIGGLNVPILASTTPGDSGVWKVDEQYTAKATSSYNAMPIQNGLQFYIDPSIPGSYSGNNNLVTYSTYNSSTWTNQFTAGATLTTTGITAPDGTTTAVRLSCTNTTNALLRVTFPTFTPNGTDSYTSSFWVRKVSGTTAAGNVLTTDVADDNPLGGNYLPLLVTGQWVRVSFTAVPTATAHGFIDLLSDNTNNYVLDFWGVQVERGPVATAYCPTNGTNTAFGINDLSGNFKNAAAVSAPICVPGKNWSFIPGRKNYINGGNFGAWPAQGTISFWMNSSDMNNYRNPIHSHYLGGNAGFRFEQTSGNSIGLIFGGDNGAGAVGWDLAANTLSTDTWYLITATWNTSTNAVVAYINTTQKLSTTYTGGWATTLPSLSIGGAAFGDSVERWYSGAIGGVMLYNRVLSAAEIAQNYDSMQGRYGSPASTIPGAPTIGTASVTSTTVASIAFTAPPETGGRALTGYRVTSTPATALYTASTSSPLSVTGNFAATQAYTFQVQSENVNGGSAFSSVSNSITPMPYLYSFTSFTFTNGGVDNFNGNSLATFQSAYSAQAWASNTSYFNVSSGVQFWKVPRTGTYTVTVAGAGGGSNYVGNGAGRGVVMSGNISCTIGDILRIVVGTRGGRYQYTGGGGGASSVVKVASMSTVSVGTAPLIMAGAGGGGGNSGGAGKDAVYTNSGVSGYAYGGGSGGSGGSPGTGTSAGGWGTSGAGWTGRGGGNANTNHVDWSGADPGYSQNGSSNIVYGATATHSTGYTSSYHDWSGSGSCVGAPGGFGGGGGGQCNGAGGGAGYSGGGVGGGAGGSYFDASVTSQTNVGYVSADTNGYVTVTFVG